MAAPLTETLIARLLNRIASAVEKGTSPAFHARMLARVGMAAGAGVSGMAARGFSGTVEGNRMNLELQMISRELAGAFLPAIKAVTGALQVFRKWLERIGPQTQNLIMLGGLAAGGLGAVGLARFGLAGLGMGGAAAAGAGGAGLARFMPPLGFVGAGAAAFGIGHEVTGAGAAYGAVRGMRAGTGALRGAARVAGPLAIGAIGADAATGGYYSELRARGENKLVSGLGALGGGLMDFVSFGTYGDAFRRRRGTGTGPFSTPEQRAAFERGQGEERRRVTIADAGFESPGSAFERITNRLALVGANEEQQDAASILLDIKNMLREAIGMEKLPAKPAMPAT